MDVYEGVVTLWNPDRFYGFVDCPMLTEHCFFHGRARLDRGYQPTVGDQVAFQIGEREGRRVAVNLQHVPIELPLRQQERVA